MGALEDLSINSLDVPLLESRLDVVNFGYQRQASLLQRKGITYVQEQNYRYIGIGVNSSKASRYTRAASIPVPTLPTAHSSLVGVVALAGLLLASPLAIARPCRISRAKT